MYERITQGQSKCENTNRYIKIHIKKYCRRTPYEKPLYTIQIISKNVDI